MSEENVEVVRRAYVAFNEGDLGAALAAMDPDIEWNASDVFFDHPRTYRGRRAWQEEFLRDLMQLFETYRGEPETLLDAGDEVVAVVWVGGRGRRSGADAMARVAHVFAFRDDKVVRFTELRDVDAALEAAGLRESAMSQENVEIVKSLLPDDADVVPLIRDDATWRRRRTEVEALLEPDHAVIWIAHGQRPIEATGADDARQGWLDWLEPWETYRVQIERIVPVGDRVVVLVRVRGRMAGTQNDVELLAASIYVVRDGRVASIEHYADRAEALETVGLEA